jgi:hypothetical protein
MREKKESLLQTIFYKNNKIQANPQTHHLQE